MFNEFESNLGMRIRYYRTRAGMTQKTLANACGISEPAIRNYELGNRNPSFETLEDIAAALHVNYYTLADPDLSTLAGVLHCLFRMEYAHGLRPIDIDGSAALIIDSKCHGGGNSYIQQMLNQWLKARTKLENSEWSPEEYEDWESQYPVVMEIKDNELKG